jgi:hypothetical protein
MVYIPQSKTPQAEIYKNFFLFDPELRDKIRESLQRLLDQLADATLKDISAYDLCVFIVDCCTEFNKEFVDELHARMSGKPSTCSKEKQKEFAKALLEE